jgi:hypothetical protein
MVFIGVDDSRRMGSPEAMGGLWAMTRGHRLPRIGPLDVAFRNKKRCAMRQYLG